MQRSARKIIIGLAAILCALSVCSCEKQSDDIVETFDTPEEVSQITGVEPIKFVPDGFKVSAHRTVYDIVSEVEYIPTEGYSKEKPKILVFRAVDAVYSTTNLSGFTDTALSEVYYPASRSDISLSIEARDEFLAVEWTDSFAEKDCKLSLSLTNGSIDEFKKIINATLEYISSSAK